MSTVNFDHRDTIGIYTRPNYENFSRQLIKSFSKLDGVRSIVICGSLIKDTLVAGWSDLDVIVFLDDQTKLAKIIPKFGHILSLLQQKTVIPVGLDLVFSNTFVQTLRLGGRPFAMTFEVSGYGTTMYGDDYLKSVTWSDSYTPVVQLERRKLIAAEIHNWRRWAVSTPKDTPTQKLAVKNIKTCLKLMKYETDPNLAPPYTYAHSLEKVKKNRPTHPQLSAWRLAVETREQWPLISSKPRALADVNRSLFHALAEYREG